MKKLIVLCLAFFVVGACVMVAADYKKADIISILNNIKSKEVTSEKTTQEDKETPDSEKINQSGDVTDNKKMYAVWLTYSEIGDLIKGKTESEYKQKLETVFGNLKANKINTVFYQCRAFCDSFYASDIFPASKYITVNNKKPAFDPFAIFLEMAKTHNISVHCWVNPYRASYDNEIENLPKNSPARELYKENKNTLIVCDKGIYLNPATEEARELVLNGIREILDKYQVAGVHFDDYFYPETEDINDGKLYEEYRNQGGKLSMGEWRRENVNVLLSSAYSLLKAYNDALVFSVSPSADIRKCRDVLYADVEKWCSEEGFVDVIIPQLYYGFENEKMPFTEVMRAWEKLVEGSSKKLVCGIAPYKCGRVDDFAGKGKNEWRENVNILSRQYEQVLKTQCYQGFALFSYSYCFGENVTQISEKEIKNLVFMVE